MNKDEINEYIEDLLTVACCPGHDYSCKEVYKYVKQLQSNWNSLRKCIIGIIEEARDELNTIIHTTDTSTEDGLKYVNQCSREFDVIRKNLEIVLDKMNELEEEMKKL